MKFYSWYGSTLKLLVRGARMTQNFNDNSYRYLNDDINNLVCYCLPVNSHTNIYAQWLRQHFIDKSESMGYRGYDTSYDDNYHRRSTYFYIKKQGANHSDALLIMRLTGADISMPFPFESGIHSGKLKYSLSHRENIIDMNTFFSSGTHLRAGFQLLLTAIGSFAKTLGANRCFGLVDVNQAKIEKFYTTQGGLLPSTEFPNPIHFSGYTFHETPNGTRNDVEWRVLEWGTEEINAYSGNVVQYELEQKAGN